MGVVMRRMRIGLVGAAVVALALAWSVPAVAGTPTRRAASRPRVLLVGSYHGRAGTYSSIQSAVDAAAPGDWVLVGPGDYHERADYRHDGAAAEAGGAVLVTTPGIHIRGMDRNTVVVDGTKPGASTCSTAPGDQDLGPRDPTDAPVGRDGVFVSKVDGVSVENLTACNFLNGHGGGNAIWFNGGDGSGTTGMGSFLGDYLTATTSYFESGHPQAEYGIIVSNVSGPGVVDHSYASNMADSSYFFGACPDCQTWLMNAHAQGSALFTRSRSIDEWSIPLPSRGGDWTLGRGPADVPPNAAWSLSREAPNRKVPVTAPHGSKFVNHIAHR